MSSPDLADEKSNKVLDIPPVDEVLELIHDSGCHLYASEATLDIFKVTLDNFIREEDAIITVAEFYSWRKGPDCVTS